MAWRKINISKLRRRLWYLHYCISTANELAIVQSDKNMQPNGSGSDCESSIANALEIMKTYTSAAKSKTVVTTLPMHQRYHSFVLSQWAVLCITQNQNTHVSNSRIGKIMCPVNSIQLQFWEIFLLTLMFEVNSTMHPNCFPIEKPRNAGRLFMLWRHPV